MVGKTLGHYEILEPLGQGGMGEVYRARDTNLDREVAIKVLPEDLAADPERLGRLTREAKLLAQLNHPNIAAVHGLEDDGDTRLIAMELVEGETLADRIARSGRFEVDEALRIARQIAEALEAAHENGIIHRDLKPANVKLTPEGKVKVLDFGLAKAGEAEASSEPSGDLSHSPTVAGATAAGVILGTAAYMSPEQARGRPTDVRTDIWAFGALFYELLGGQRAFKGDTATDLLAAVVKEEPDWRALPASTPGQVLALVRRCMRKNPENRLHHIADARIEIDEAIRGRADESRDRVAASSEGGTLRLVALVAAALVVITAVVFWRSTPEEPLVYLMDTAAPLGVYDARTRTQGGTNADDVSDLLGDLPVRTARETVNPHWHREHEVLTQSPALIVVHRSAFAHQPGIDRDEQVGISRGELDELGLEDPYELGWSKLISFLGYVGLGNLDTKFLVYSRGFVDQEGWVDDVVARFPQLEGKVTTYSVPLDADGNASFRDSDTGDEVKRLVISILGLQ